MQNNDPKNGLALVANDLNVTGNPVVFNQTLKVGQLSAPFNVQDDQNGMFKISVQGSGSDPSCKVNGQSCGQAGDNVVVQCGSASPSCS
jgi:hypothetical protein